MKLAKRAFPGFSMATTGHLRASHQTGWTGHVAKLIQLFGTLDPRKVLEADKAAAFDRIAPGE